MADEGKVVKKAWGEERYITNTPGMFGGTGYCAKELVVGADKVCSRHRHLEKDEFFRVEDGEGFIEVNDRIYQVYIGDYIHIPRGTWHRFWTTRGMILLEISSHHKDEDVERETKSDIIYRVNKEPLPEVKWSTPGYGEASKEFVRFGQDPSIKGTETSG